MMLLLVTGYYAYLSRRWCGIFCSVQYVQHQNSTQVSTNIPTNHDTIHCLAHYCIDEGNLLTLLCSSLIVLGVV